MTSREELERLDDEETAAWNSHDADALRAGGTEDVLGHELRAPSTPEPIRRARCLAREARARDEGRAPPP